MISRSVQLSLLALVSASMCSAATTAKASKAVPAKAPVAVAKRSGEKTVNIRPHERRINAHYAQMVAAGKEDELSAAFMEVHAAMQQGNYSFGVETAKQVLRESQGERRVGGLSHLQNRLK